ncbi:MAG: hypothetical protein RIC80_05885 [Cyclobacteriaceae bacterium]
MKVLNIHERIIDQPVSKVSAQFLSLAKKDDKIWPIEQWPPMRFRDGLKEGAVGGHGPIRYKVIQYDPLSSVTFQFQKPHGFNGIHTLAFEEMSDTSTLLRHTIDMHTSGLGTVLWIVGIRWLHDALIEDAFDKVENQLTQSHKKTRWNVWVRFLRVILK